MTECGVLSAGTGTCRRTHRDRRTCGPPAGRAAGAGVQGGQTPPYSGRARLAAPDTPPEGALERSEHHLGGWEVSAQGSGAKAGIGGWRGQEL